MAVVVMVIMTWRRTWTIDRVVTSESWPVPLTSYDIPTYFVSTLFCIFQWHSLSIYVLHFDFDDLMENLQFMF